MTKLRKIRNKSYEGDEKFIHFIEKPRNEKTFGDVDIDRKILLE
jgi:hypothetical protein